MKFWYYDIILTQKTNLKETQLISVIKAHLEIWCLEKRHSKQKSNIYTKKRNKIRATNENNQQHDKLKKICGNPISNVQNLVAIDWMIFSLFWDVQIIMIYSSTCYQRVI